MRRDVNHSILLQTRLDEIAAGFGTVSAPLGAAMSHAALSSGKRFRGNLLLLAADASGGVCETIVDAACAIEMVHAASLVFDDLPCMDDAALRRGQPATHVAHGESRAVLGGIALITEATIHYLSRQIEAGAEVVKLFDSWAGSLKGRDFDDFALAPARRIIAALKERHPDIPVIAFPREAGERYIGFAKATGADCVALDNSVEAEWAARAVQVDGCVQGNLDPRHMVTGGPDLVREAQRITRALRGGPHVFNLGHGITPDADPDNVARMIDAVRSA